MLRADDGKLRAVEVSPIKSIILCAAPRVLDSGIPHCREIFGPEKPRKTSVTSLAITQPLKGLILMIDPTAQLDYEERLESKPRRVMPMRNDLTGQRFGRCIVLGPDGHMGNSRAWKCQCQCGNIFRKPTNAFAPSQTAVGNRLFSCGCAFAERKAYRKEHGNKSRKINIDPDISAKSVSRQRKLQLQWRRNGCCVQCGKPTTIGKRGFLTTFCENCLPSRNQKYRAQTENSSPSVPQSDPISPHGEITAAESTANQP